LDNDDEFAIIALDPSDRPVDVHKFESDDRQQHESAGNQECR
jgi:hypothetical protein